MEVLVESDEREAEGAWMKYKWKQSRNRRLFG